MHNVGELFKPLMAKNQLYSYEYLRTLMALDVDPNDIPDAQLKQHPMIVVGNPDKRSFLRLESFEGRASIRSFE